MENFKQILSKLSVIFLLFYSQNIFSMTQTEIQLEKAYLAEMIDIVQMKQTYVSENLHLHKFLRK